MGIDRRSGPSDSVPPAVSPAAPIGEAQRGFSARHLTFRAGSHEVEIRVKADEFRHTASISGVVRERDGSTLSPERLQVWLLSPGAEMAGLPVSRRGFFTARQVSGGRQILEVVVDCDRCHRLCFFI
jgi:hypothetical protein